MLYEKRKTLVSMKHVQLSLDRPLFLQECGDKVGSSVRFSSPGLAAI